MISEIGAQIRENQRVILKNLRLPILRMSPFFSFSFSSGDFTVLSFIFTPPWEVSRRASLLLFTPAAMRSSIIPNSLFLILNFGISSGASFF